MAWQLTLHSTYVLSDFQGYGGMWRVVRGSVGHRSQGGDDGEVSGDSTLNVGGSMADSSLKCRIVLVEEAGNQNAFCTHVED